MIQISQHLQEKLYIVPDALKALFPQSVLKMMSFEFFRRPIISSFSSFSFSAKSTTLKFLLALLFRIGSPRYMLGTIADKIIDLRPRAPMSNSTFTNWLDIAARNSNSNTNALG